MSNKRRHSFGAFHARQRQEMARKGGQRAHAKGTAHEFTSAEARATGRNRPSAPL